MGRRESKAHPHDVDFSEYVSERAHDLRSPLTAILGFGGLLSMDELTPQQREAVDEIVKAGRNLLGLIDEVVGRAQRSLDGRG